MCDNTQANEHNTNSHIKYYNKKKQSELDYDSKATVHACNCLNMHETNSYTFG